MKRKLFSFLLVTMVLNLFSSNIGLATPSHDGGNDDERRPPSGERPVARAETPEEFKVRLRREFAEWLDNRKGDLKDYSKLTDDQKDQIGIELRKFTLNNARDIKLRLRHDKGNADYGGYLVIAHEDRTNPDKVKRFEVLSTKTMETVSLPAAVTFGKAADGTFVAASKEAPAKFWYGIKEFEVVGKSSPASRTTYAILKDKDGTKFQTTFELNSWTKPVEVKE